MGKKNKNRDVDYFNMTPEEQMANAEMFHDVEQGEVSFLDALNYKVPTAPIAQSDYKKQIEKACLGLKDEDDEDTYTAEIDAVIQRDEIKDDNSDNECTNGYIPYMSLIDNSFLDQFPDSDDEDDDEDITNNDDDDDDNVVIDIDEPLDLGGTNCTSSDVVDEKSDSIPRIRFTYNPIIGKMLIDDGLVSTPVSVIHTSSIQLHADKIPEDSDGYAAMMSKIFYFIITCKHPAVIMSEDTFEIEFSPFSKINFNKFIFFKNDGFVYVYILDEGESDNFYSVSDVFNMDEDELMRFAVGAAYASNTMHNIFMYNDGDEVESVMEVRHSVKELLEIIENDPDTKYAGHQSSGDVLSKMHVNDLQSFVSDVYSLLDDLIVSDDSDDEDDFDEEDTDDNIDDDVDINDFPDIDSNMKTETDDIEQLLDSIDNDENYILKHTVKSDMVSVTETTTIDKVKTQDSDDDMVLPIIHRNS